MEKLRIKYTGKIFFVMWKHSYDILNRKEVKN